MQDGGSGGEVDQLRNDYPWAKLVSDVDQGIYDAMNRGILRAQGKALWFLNGGDECLVQDWETLGCLEKLGDQIFYFDFEIVSEGRRVHRQSRPAWYILHALPTSHQAIIYPHKQVERVLYPLEYSVSADYAYTATLLKNGFKAVCEKVTLAAFFTGGTSTVRANDIGKDAARVQKFILRSRIHSRVVSRVVHKISATFFLIKHAGKSS